MQPMKYTEAIGLALVIAAVLGSSASIVLERGADPEIACAVRPSPGSVDESLWNLHCAHVAEMRALDRPTQLAGHGRTIPHHTPPAGAEPSAVIGHPPDERDCLAQASAGFIVHNAGKPELGSSVVFARPPCEGDGLHRNSGLP
jgi:hypothetical protein